MRVIKFRDTIINGVDESTLNWTEIAEKQELMVEVFTSEKLFEDLSIYWKGLEKRADNKIYMSYDWAYNWWKHFGKNEQRSLFIVTIWDGTKLVGVAPFYKGYSKFGSVTLERRLQIIGSGGSPNEQLGYRDDYGISPFLDLVVDRSYCTPVADLLAEDIFTYKFLGVDTLKFHHAGDDSFIMNYLYPRLQDTPGLHRKQSDTCPYIDLHRKESVMGGAGVRRRHKQNLRVLDIDHQYVIEDVSDSMGQVVKGAENIIELHQSQSNRQGLPGVFYDERVTRFFKDILEYAFKNNWLWFKQVKDNGEVRASRIALWYNGRYYDYISSLDQSAVEFRYGLGLFSDLIKDGIKRRAHRIELSKGKEEYESDFSSDSFKNWTLTVPLGQRKMNIPLLLNRIGSFFYKFFIREARFINVQRQQKGILKMIPGYINSRLQSATVKLKS